MPLGFYLDVHIPRAITEQLRLRGVAVLTATEEGTNRRPDDFLREKIAALGRVIFTQDIRLSQPWRR